MGPRDTKLLFASRRLLSMVWSVLGCCCCALRGPIGVRCGSLPACLPASPQSPVRGVVAWCVGTAAGGTQNALSLSLSLLFLCVPPPPPFFFFLPMYLHSIALYIYARAHSTRAKACVATPLACLLACLLALSLDNPTCRPSPGLITAVRAPHF